MLQDCLVSCRHARCITLWETARRQHHISETRYVAGERKSTVTSHTPPVDILKVSFSLCSTPKKHSVDGCALCRKADSYSAVCLQADWFVKHRQRRPAVAVLFLSRHATKLLKHTLLSLLLPCCLSQTGPNLQRLSGRGSCKLVTLHTAGRRCQRSHTSQECPCCRYCGTGCRQPRHPR